MDPEPAAVARSRGEGAAERGDAFAHADQAVTAAVQAVVGRGAGRSEPAGRPALPRPLSSTVTSAVAPTRTTLTSALAPAPACLRTLVRASWMTR